MSLLNRPDGIQFVVQAYRERLPLGKRSNLVSRICALAEQHGQYVLLSPVGQQFFEAVFSRQPGYLLGETVWTYFERQAYLIYCERLSRDNNQVLLVVIRNNEVYLDSLVDNDKLRVELLPLSTSQETFRVIVYGEVSLTEHETTGNHFVLPKNIVSSFEIAKEPIYKSLPAIDTWRLLTLPLALKSPLLGSRVPVKVIALGVAIVIAGAWWVYKISEDSSSMIIPKATAQKPDNSYTDFYSAMRTPMPSLQLNELAQTIEKFYALPGWQTGQVRYDSGQYRIELDRQGGTIQWLTQWAGNNQYMLNFGSKVAEIVLPSNLPGRPRPQALYSLQPVMASLIDQLDSMFPNQVINLSDVKQFGLTKSRVITINLTDVSPDVLTFIGKNIGNDLPLSITAVNVNVRTGLLSGSIQLSVWGI